jgi:hypothetical protein
VALVLLPDEGGVTGKALPVGSGCDVPAPNRVVACGTGVRLDGDRYANRAGTFTPRSGHGVGYDLTLIEAEVLDELTSADGHQLGYAEARSNIITRGIDLNTLVGQRFRVGDVEGIGRRLCEPCAHLERLTYKGVLRKLIHRGGLRGLTSGGTPRSAIVPDQSQVVVVGGGAERGRTPSCLLAEDAVELGIAAETGLVCGGQRRGALPSAVETQKTLQSLLVAEPADRHAGLFLEYPAQV